jgi:sulfide dehydrogenase [flavocytochrome c] flavoprotein subunit
MSFNRREFLKTLATTSAIVPFSARTARAAGKARIVVVGGGFGGATAAKYLKKMDPALDVTLVEKLKTFTSCPLSNEVISGHGKIEDLQAGYDGLEARRQRHVRRRRGRRCRRQDRQAQERQDPELRRPGPVTRHRLQLCGRRGLQRRTRQYQPPSRLESRSPDPGPEEAAGRHAGRPDLRLLSVPPGPFRCPPGPYERASQVASYFKHHGMHKSKVLIADANDSFSKKGLFEQAWKMHYPGMIEWVAGAAGGKVVKFDAKTNTASSDFNDFKGDVVNIIPPHHAGNIAKRTGLTNDKGWCTVDMLTMESTVHKDIYVVGDSTVHGELPVYGAPKSAHMANTQAKVAVGAIIAKLNGVAAPEPFFVNTCYSIVAADDWGFSVVHIYRARDGKLIYDTKAGGISPVTMADESLLKLQRKLESNMSRAG